MGSNAQDFRGRKPKIVYEHSLEITKNKIESSVNLPENKNLKTTKSSNLAFSHRFNFFAFSQQNNFPNRKRMVN